MTKRHPLYGQAAEDKPLGSAILIAEFASGGYEPVAASTSVRQAYEMALWDLRLRRRDRRVGGSPASPTMYRLWCSDYEGEYAVVQDFAVVRGRLELSQRRL